MPKPYVSRRSLPEFSLWDKMWRQQRALSFDLEATARCNLNCRHCYINLPAGDKTAKKHEVTLPEIARLGGEAAGLGAFWCLLTGGEPLLRKDFFEIYLALKKQGLLISVYTNATLIRDEHVRFFQKYPPRDIEVTVYGVTKGTYERVTRTPESFEAFQNGLALLKAGGVKVRLKAMALRSNVHELAAIARFCRDNTRDYFRFDPFLHYRYDRDEARNREIESERLAPEEVVALERGDSERMEALEAHCDQFIISAVPEDACTHIFRCGAGMRHFVIGHDAHFRLCQDLLEPRCLYSLRKGSLSDALARFVPEVRGMTSDRGDYLDGCAKCPIINLCLWCPAHAYLEKGDLDAPVDKFCQIAHARAQAIKIVDKSHEGR
jgi:radical SAM protein with 4Fe4S-binding SPASM domain